MMIERRGDEGIDPIGCNPGRHAASNTYRPDIDGLRAIAIVLVLLFHADIVVPLPFTGITLACPGGYVGVDVFFVISGFLITKIILDRQRKDTFQLGDFWERRVRRIVPALALMLVATLVAGWWILLPRDLVSLAESVLAQAAFASNVYFWRKINYFDPTGEMLPLLHTWSLAVEEQFYLLLPLLLVAIRKLRPATRVASLVGIGGASMAASVYGSVYHPAAAFFLLPARAWEMLLGCSLAAIGTAPRSAAVRELAGAAGLAAIAYSGFFFDQHTRFPGLNAGLPCGGAALVIWSNGPGARLTLTSRLLSTPVLVFIGLISYSLYLWHWPLLVYAKYISLTPLTTTTRLVILGLTFALAAASWRWVETPFRGQGVVKSRRTAFRAAGAAYGAFVATAGLVIACRGAEWRLPALAKTLATVTQNTTYRQDCSLADARAGRFIELGETTNRTAPVALFVWGDSHAASTMPVIDEVGRDHGLRMLGPSASATAPLLGYVCRSPFGLRGDSVAYNQAILEFVRSQGIKDVLLIASWLLYLREDGGPDGLRKSLAATVRALDQAGITVWILPQVPEQPWDVPRALARIAMQKGDMTSAGLTLAEYRDQIARMSEIWQDLGGPNVRLLDPTNCFYGGGSTCPVYVAGQALYADKSHVTPAGAARLRPLIEQILGSRAIPIPDASSPKSPAGGGHHNPANATPRMDSSPLKLGHREITL